MKNIDFKTTIPSWLRNVSYTVMFLEVVLVVIIYHAPDVFVGLVGLFA